MTLRIVSCALLATIAAKDVAAQEYAFRRYGAEAGLRGPQATAFDGQGSLLVGTNDGIASFDGRSFVDVPLPWRSGAWRLEPAPDGAVWGLSTRPGLVRIAPGRLAESIPVPAPLRARLRETVWPIRLRTDGNGRAWLSGGDGTIYRWNGPSRRTWSAVTVPGIRQLGDFFVRGDGEDGEVVFAAGDRVGVIELIGGRARRLTWIGAPGGVLVFVRPHPSAAAWAGGSDGVYLLNRDGTSRQVGPIGERVWPHSQPEVDGSGRLLVLFEARAGTHVLRFERDGSVSLDAGAQQGLPGLLPIGFSFDPEGGFWLADRRWLVSLEDTHNRRYPLRGTSAEIVHGMSGDPASGPFIVGTYLAVYRLSGDHFERLSPPGTRFILPFGLRAGPDPQWIQWDNSTSVHTAAGRMPAGRRAVLDEGPIGRYEVDERGLWRISQGRQVHVAPDVLPGAVGRLDPGGRLWLAGEIDQLDVVIGDSLGSRCRACLDASLRTAIDSLNGRMSAGTIEADRYGHIWVQGVTGGLGTIWQSDAGQWRWRVFYPPDGLLGAVVALALSPDGRRLWAGTSNGIQGLELSPRAPSLRSFIELGARDGLASDMVSALSEDSRGFLWASTQSGFVERLEWRAMRRGAASPAVRVERVEVNGQPTAFGSRPVRLRSGDGLTVALAARTYRQPLRVRLEYRLQGRDTAWSSLGTARDLALAALPPGPRDLQVRAVREGRPPGPTMTLALDVQPPFFLSPWFGLLLLVGLSAAAWSARTVQNGRRRAAERVRLRIAEDLHDEVGSGLAQVALYSELIRRMATNAEGDNPSAPADPGIGEFAGRVGEQVDALSGSMRDLVWAIRPEARSWDDLELRIKDAAVSLVTPHGIEADLRGDVEAAIPIIAPEVCQNVLLFAKEAIHNAIRHAGATRIEGRWRVDRQSLRLSIADNGRGFDFETARRGMGLLSMRRRAETLGGTFEITTGIDEGTRVTIHVPLRRF